MSTTRKRRHPTVTVTSAHLLPAVPPPWEVELVLAALVRLSAPVLKEVPDGPR